MLLFRIFVIEEPNSDIMKNRIFFSIILLVFLTRTAYSSVNVQSTFITSSEGLGNNQVHHIFQDSKGFLWMSTLNGLTRYDGHSFMTYRPDKNDNVSLADYNVVEVSEDRNNFLWVKVFIGYYSCYDPKNGCFVDYTGCGEYKVTYNNQMEASNGDIWLWHEETGCRKVMYKNGIFSSIVYNQKNGKLPSNNISKLIEDSKGNIWVATDKGVALITSQHTYIYADSLHIIDVTEYENNILLTTSDGRIYFKEQEKDSIRLIAKLDTSNPLFQINALLCVNDKYIILTRQKSYILHLPTLRFIDDKTFDMINARYLQDEKGNVWLYDMKGNIRYINTLTNTIKDIKVDISYTFSTKWCDIIKDSRGLIWIATDGHGLYIFEPDTDELTHYTYQDEGLNRINSNSLINITEDRSGSIWVCSTSAGISHLLVLNNATRVYPENKSLINHSNSIRMLSPMKNGDIWIGNRIGTIYKYDNQLQNKLQTRQFDSGIYKIMEDSYGKTWLGSRRNGLCIDGRWYTHQPYDSLSLSSDKIFDIFCDYKQRIWIATFGGGMNLATPHGETYQFRQYLTYSPREQEVRTIISDKNNWMWVGTVSGLCVLHPDSLLASPNNYYRYNYQNDRLLGSEVKSLFYDSKGRMWIGTLGGGISVCESQNNYSDLQFTHYTTNNGLVNDMVQAIVEDQDGKIWISTEFGISRFCPENKTFENFFFSNSTLGNVYNENSGIVLSDGRLLFGSDHGLVVIHPQKINSPHVISDIALTNLKINGIPVYPHEKDSPLSNTLTYTDDIKLKHYQNSFVIEFSTFDYSIINGARYTYKLDYFDKDWSEPTSLNFAAYKNLPPGSYQLHVKACNAAGVWCEQEATLQIVIAPPYWKSGWAYLIYTVLICIALYIALRLIRKFNDLRNRIQIEKQLTEYKLMFFTNISHEFRTPLTLIQGALEKIMNPDKSPQDMTHSVQLMNKSTNRMLRLINQLLEFRKMQNNKLELTLEEIDVISFFNDIFLTFKDTATDKLIDFQFTSSMPTYRMFVDTGKLDKVVYNLLSNAFKYTPKGGKIVFDVLIDTNNRQFIFFVSDTGIGIPKDKQEQLFSRFMQSSFSQNSVGIGLHLTYELVNIHKGIISFHENLPKGSVFTVTLPLEANVYDEKDFLVPNILQEDSNMKETRSDISDEIAAQSEYSNSADQKKILIIEDDNDVRKFLETELGKHFKVISEPDGLSGLERAKTSDIDLIICDVLMPGMNGFEVTRELKNNFDTSHIPVILLTAMSTQENKLEGVESGADAYITKPFSPKLLLARTFQLIEQRRKLREKFSNDPTSTDAPLCSTEIDKRFAERLRIVMEKQLSNPDFTLEDFAASMKLGRTIFFRKVKGITGYTPNEYMRIFRMKKAVELLNDGNYNVSEISYMIGMKNPYYFSKCFKEQFGVPPSTYRHGEKADD